MYAIAFAEDDSLLAAADDGNIRRISPEGALVAEFPAVEIADQQATGALAFDAKAWNEMVTQRIEAAAQQESPDRRSDRCVGSGARTIGTALSV